MAPARLGGDVVDAGQRPRFRLLDAGLGLGHLFPDLRLHSDPLLVDLGGQAIMHGLDNAGGLGARLGQSLLVGSQCPLRLGLQLLGLIEIAPDAVGALLDHLADARQGHPLEQQVEQPEADRQPHQLRHERGVVERRKETPCRDRCPRQGCAWRQWSTSEP